MFVLTMNRTGLRRLGVAALCGVVLTGTVMVVNRHLEKADAAPTAAESAGERIATTQDIGAYFSARGLEVLVKYMYGPEARSRVDLTRLGSLEMAKKHSYANYKVNPEGVLLFHEPSDISFELRGTVKLYDEKETGEASLYQQLLNAQHDVYHDPASEDFAVNLKRYHTMPAYVFTIEEIYDNSSRSPYGPAFGFKLDFPYEGM